MKQLTCEMCGSTDLMKQDGVFVCQTCGCKYSVEEAKKMMVEGTVEVTGSVKVDVSEKVENLYVMARRAKDDNNAELAAKYYEMITFENPFDWEAVFYFNYYKAKNTTLGDMINSVIRLSNSLDNVFDLIDKSEQTADKKWSIAQEIIECINTLCEFFISWAKRHYKDFSGVKGSSFDLFDRASVIANLQKTMADLLEKYFAEYSSKAVASYLKSYVKNYLLLDTLDKNYVDITLEHYSKKLIEAENRIKKLEPEYKPLVDEASIENKTLNNGALNENATKGMIQVNYQIGHYGINGWYSSPNSAGGVSVRFSIKNIGTKAIKYYALDFAPYNAVGDIVKCSIHKKSESGVSGTGPIAPNGIKRNCLFENAWYNSSIKSVKLIKAEIEYMDGTKETIQGDQITSIGYSNTTKPQQKSCTVAKIFYILSVIVPIISFGLFFAMLVNDNNSAFLFLVMTFVGPIITALIGRVIDELNWKNMK